ncbi:uncharacterized protein LOC110995993 isoform X2 [Pieris rapae]|uniref:uncharacterized protein LOC110995993 isoform X2 n=1 Tax=Pieris rapae TaxID=64459 RepID=UPI001E27F0F3|nr:uncharacterized protein LOC110995993 isoform X2 [Pieris rapae]
MILISVPKTILDRLKSTPDKHGSPVDSQINTFLLSHDPQDPVNDRNDDDVIITDNVPKVIVIPSDDAPNDDLPCVIANIKSEPLENEIQTSETKHNVTLQNDFKCKTMVIEIPKDTKDVFKRLSGENRINDDKALGINEIKRTYNVNTVDHIKKLKPRTKQTLPTDVSRNLESDVKIEVINSVDVVEEEKLMTVGLSGTQLNKEKREKARPVDTFKNLEQITPKESEVSGRIKVEKFEETVDEIDISWHTVPIKKEADPEMDFKLSNIRSLSNVGENEIDVKQEINEFDLKGQSKYWFSFANNSHLITISPNVTLNTDDERNRSHRKMGKLNKAPKTSAERGREFRARKALLKQLRKQQQEPGPLEKKQVPSEITIIEKRAKSAEATRRWREKKRGVSESSKKQAKTAAERMREYRKRKKI